MNWVWPYSLYFGILYHLGEEQKAIELYSRLGSKYCNDFQAIQQKIVMILCHHRRGESEKVMELLESIRVIQSSL